MKKHNAIKVVLITILVFLLLTWIIPAAYFSGEFVDQGRVQMGLFDLFNYPLTSLAYFGYIAFYLILVGGFYGILYKIPAYRTFLDKIVEKAKGKEKIVLSAIIVVCALLVSICGLHIGLALFIPFIISIVMLMGYDKIVCALVTVGSITVGLIGTTYAYTNISVLVESLSLKIDHQILVRFVILFAGIALLIFNTIMYINRNYKSNKKIKNDNKKVEAKEEKKEEVKVVKTTSKKSTNKKSTSKNSKKTTKSKNPNKAALKDEDVIVVSGEKDMKYVPNSVSSKHKIWPLVVVFSLLFVVFVLAFINWNEKVFAVSLFDDMQKAVSEFKLFGFPLFGKILGTFNSFGNWTITDMFVPMAIAVILLMIIYKIKFEDVFEGFVEGAKEAITPAVIVILIYTVLVIVTYHPFQLVIYKTILGFSKGFNIVTTSLVAVLASFFNADIAYSFQSVIPYYASVVTDVDNYSLVAIIFQSMYGLTMLVAPTSLVLMGVLSYLNIPYKKWLNVIWKLLLELFVVLLIIFIILALI